MPSYKKLRNILNKVMYHDTATISRQMPIKDAEGADDYKVVAVYKDIPCKLSQYKDNSTTVTDRQVDINMDFRLCCAPVYDIQPNDIIKVKHRGQKFLLNADKAFKYPTHQEISVRKVSEAGWA